MPTYRCERCGRVYTAEMPFSVGMRQDDGSVIRWTLCRDCRDDVRGAAVEALEYEPGEGLEPCPLCGAQRPEIRIRNDARVVCPGCGAEYVIEPADGMSLPRAVVLLIKGWNRRAGR